MGEESHIFSQKVPVFRQMKGSGELDVEEPAPFFVLFRLPTLSGGLLFLQGPPFSIDHQPDLFANGYEMKSLF